MSQALLLLVRVLWLAWATRAVDEARALYPYSFGGLETRPVGKNVNLLKNLGYIGLAVDGRGTNNELPRLSSYLALEDDQFTVVNAFMAHQFDRYGWNPADHFQVIDILASHKAGGRLWLWFKDDGTATAARMERFVRRIHEYAVQQGVVVVLYPHFGTYFPHFAAAMTLVDKINDPSLQVAISLHHERLSDKQDNLPQSFTEAMNKGVLGAVVLSGQLEVIDWTTQQTMSDSVTRALDDSPYDLKPFMTLVRDSGFTGPVGFINFRLSQPVGYLMRSMTVWQDLCAQVGLVEPPAPSPPPMIRSCHQQYVEANLPIGCTIQVTFSSTLTNCQAARPSKLYRLVEGTEKACRFARGAWAAPMFCKMVQQGNVRGVIGRASCLGAARRCKKMKASKCN